MAVIREGALVTYSRKSRTAWPPAFGGAAPLPEDTSASTFEWHLTIAFRAASPTSPEAILGTNPAVEV